VELTEADCVPNQVVALNGYLAVILAENPTTGFSWRTWWDPGQALRTLYDRYLAPPEPAVPGRGGLHRWVFKTLQPGVAVLYFQYGRPWSAGEQGIPRLLVLQVTEPAAG
jgi:predicted secreted protein